MSDKIEAGDLVEITQEVKYRINGRNWEIVATLSPGSKFRVFRVSEISKMFAIRIRDANTGDDIIRVWVDVDRVKLSEKVKK